MSHSILARKNKIQNICRIIMCSLYYAFRDITFTFLCICFLLHFLVWSILTFILSIILYMRSPLIFLMLVFCFSSCKALHRLVYLALPKQVTVKSFCWVDWKTQSSLPTLIWYIYTARINTWKCQLQSMKSWNICSLFLLLPTMNSRRATRI